MNVSIEEETLRRIKGFTRLASGEVAGIARVLVDNGEVYIHDLRLFSGQSVSSAHVSLTQEQLVGFLSSVDNPQDFKFLWHSHVNMTASLSVVDLNCIDSFLQTSDFVISCVSNKPGVLFIQFDGLLNGIRIKDSCKIKPKDEAFLDLKEELDANVTQKPEFIGSIPDGRYRNRYDFGDAFSYKEIGSDQGEVDDCLNGSLFDDAGYDGFFTKKKLSRLICLNKKTIALTALMLMMLIVIFFMLLMSGDG